MAETGTPREELEHLCGAVAGVAGGHITVSGQATIIEAIGWLPPEEVTPPRPRVRVWGAVLSASPGEAP